MHRLVCAFVVYLHQSQVYLCGSSGRSRGVRLNPPPRPPFLISYENEIIWSQWDQIISFSWDIQEKWDKISKANPHTFIHMNPLSRNPGSTPGKLENTCRYAGWSVRICLDIAYHIYTQCLDSSSLQYLTFACSVIFHAFVVIWLFFKINFFKNILGTLSECQMVWIQIGTDILSVLIWVQTVCKSYDIRRGHKLLK